MMWAKATRFRERAVHCRELAKGARDEEARRTLNDIAKELDDEADRIDVEEGEALGGKAPRPGLRD